MPFLFWLGMVGWMVGALALDGRRNVHDPSTRNVSDHSVSRKDFNQIIKNFDRNNDGAVSKAEFVASIEVLSDQKESLAATRQGAETLFAELDTGSTGSVPLDQMTKLFDLFDANGDGVITEQENVQKWKAYVPASS